MDGRDGVRWFQHISGLAATLTARASKGSVQSSSPRSQEKDNPFKEVNSLSSPTSAVAVVVLTLCFTLTSPNLSVKRDFYHTHMDFVIFLCVFHKASRLYFYGTKIFYFAELYSYQLSSKRNK